MVLVCCSPAGDVLDASARALHARIRRTDFASLRRHSLIEQIDELAFLGRGGIADVVRDQDGTQAGDGQGGGIEARLKIGLVVHGEVVA